MNQALAFPQAIQDRFEGPGGLNTLPNDLDTEIVIAYIKVGSTLTCQSGDAPRR